MKRINGIWVALSLMFASSVAFAGGFSPTAGGNGFITSPLSVSEVDVDTVKAKTAAGDIVFKDSAGNTLGTISDGGNFGAVATTGGSGNGASSSYGEFGANPITIGRSTISFPYLTAGTIAAQDLSVVAGVADGASNVAITLNNAVTLGTAGAKLVSIKNNGTERLAIDLSGAILFTNGSGTAPAGTNNWLGLATSGDSWLNAPATKNIRLGVNNIAQFTISANNTITSGGSSDTTFVGVNGQNFKWTDGTNTLVTIVDDGTAGHLTVSGTGSTFGGTVSATGTITPTSGASGAAALTNYLKQNYTIDFGAFAGGGAAQSSAQAMTGVAFGDACYCDADADTSAEFAACNVTIVSAGNIKIFISPLTAAGTVNPASHVYYVHCTR